MACSLSFRRACTESDHVLSVDGIDIPAHVYGRSGLLRELVTDEHVAHGNVSLPLTPAAFLAWAHFKDASSNLSVQDLFGIAQVAHFLHDEDTYDQTVRALALRVRWQMRASSAPRSSFTEALHCLPFCPSPPTTYHTSSTMGEVNAHGAGSSWRAHREALSACTTTVMSGSSSEPPSTDASVPEASASCYFEDTLATMSSVEGPVLASVLHQLSLSETCTLPQPIFKASLLAHCSAGYLSLSACSVAGTPVQNNPQLDACLCPRHHSALWAASCALLPEVAPKALNLSFSCWHNTQEGEVSRVLAQLSSLTALEVSKPAQVSLLQAATTATATTGLQALTMRGLSLNDSVEDTDASKQDGSIQTQQVSLVNCFKLSSGPQWSNLRMLDMKGCSMMRPDYCDLLQTVSVLSSLNFLDLSGLHLHPKGNRMQRVKDARSFHAYPERNSTGSPGACLEEDWLASAEELCRMPLGRFKHLGVTVEPSADALCSALATALRTMCVDGQVAALATYDTHADDDLEPRASTSGGKVLAIDEKGCRTVYGSAMESLVVTNAVDPAGWADDNSSQVSRHTATALFAAIASIPSLETLTLTGMPIGYPPSRPPRTQHSSTEAPRDQESVNARNSARAREARVGVQEELYALVADLAAPDQRRRTVTPAGMRLPLKCMELQGLDFGIRTLYDPRSAAYVCSGDRIAMYSWDSLRALTRLSLISVQLFRHGHAAEVSRGLEQLTGLQSLRVARYAGVGGVFHAPQNTAMFLAAVGSLTTLTELDLEGADLHISSLFDEADDDFVARPLLPGQLPPPLAATALAAIQGRTALHMRGLSLLSSLTNLQSLSLQGSCCWRMLSGGASNALQSLTAVTRLCICVCGTHTADGYSSVRTPSCRGGSLQPLEGFWRPAVSAVAAMTQLQDLKLRVYTTHGDCTALKSLTALTSMVLAVRCSPGFTTAPLLRPHRPDLDHPHLQHHTSWPFMENASVGNMQGSSASLDVPAPAAPMTMQASPDASASATAASSRTGGRSTDHIQQTQRGSSNEDAGSSGASQSSALGVGGTCEAGTAGSGTATPTTSASQEHSSASHCWVDMNQVTDEADTSAAGQEQAKTRQSPFVAKQLSPSLIAAAHLSELLSDLVCLQRVVLACCLPHAAAGGDLHDGLNIGDAECERLAHGLQRLSALQRLEIKADTSKMTEAGSKMLFQAVQAAPLCEGIHFSSPES